MRYSINPQHGTFTTKDIVDGTVIYTLIVGMIFLYFGIKAKKIWIKSWGILTIIACSGYFIFSLRIF